MGVFLPMFYHTHVLFGNIIKIKVTVFVTLTDKIDLK